MTTSAEGHTVTAAIQARMASTRLPGKALADLCGEPMIARIYERLTYATSPDSIVVATTTDPTDDAIAEECERRGFPYVRGPVDKLAVRLAMAGEAQDADVVVRVWGDCPCVDPEIVDDAVGALVDGQPSMVEVRGVYGLGVEVYRLDDLLAVPEDHATAQLYPKHYVREGRGATIFCPYFVSAALTVDYPEDLERTRAIYSRLYSPDRPFTWREVVQLPDSILSIGQDHERNVEYKEAMCP